MRWACSLSEIDWQRNGIEARKLGGLLAEVSGFFNQRHRADADVAALVALLASQLPAGHTAFAEMLFTAMRPTVRIVAVLAPYAAKDALKARRYRWNDKRKVWWRDVAEQERDAELAWYVDAVGGPTPLVSTITWFERHRA